LITTAPSGATEDKMEDHKKFRKIIKERDFAGVIALISAGADINARSKNNGKSPLIIALETGDVRIINALVKAGADLSVRYDAPTGRPGRRIKDGADIFQWRERPGWTLKPQNANRFHPRLRDYIIKNYR